MDAVEINTSDPPQNEEEGIVSTVEICRVCLLGNLVMRDLFLESEVASLSVKAMSFANVKMLPGDGLPARVCCVCADKLESAYEFKLQVEQADTVLRERFVAMNMKEELFFNEVEVHLETERNEGIGDMHMDAHYEAAAEALASVPQNGKTSLLKDQLAFLQVAKLSQQEETEREQDDGGHEMEEDMEQVAVVGDTELRDRSTSRDEEDVRTMENASENEMSLKCENIDGTDMIPTEEHDYILQQEYILSHDQQTASEESFRREDNLEKQVESLEEIDAMDPNENQEEDMPIPQRVNASAEQDSSRQSESRRGKRKLVRRTISAVERDSDEENYFENLNLSSRLKKAQADKSEKIFFVCYLCDKQFLSKNVLKEHMHSHEEVRRALSLKKTPEKPQKITGSPAKMPPSGKRANKCPYCGKEYLYIISFSKHLKQHEKEKEDGKDESMPLEVSFHEDEHSLDFDNCNSSRHSDIETSCKRRTRREDPSQEVVEDGIGDGREKEKQRKRNRTEAFPCEKCSEKFQTRRGLRKHAIIHVNLKCSVCEEEFDSLEKLRNHRSKHVVEGVLTEQDLEEETKHAIGKEVGYGADEREEGDEDNEESESLENEFRRNRNAETRSPGKDHLQRHEEQHARVKSYKCTQCNKIFGNELTLRNHLIATSHKTFVHGQEYDPNKRIKRVAARAAQKIIDKIKTEDGLEDYEDDEDDDGENCDRAEFDSSYGRKRESSQKKCNYRKELECATCNKRCSSKQSLTKHMEQHVKDEKAERAEKLDKLKKTTDKKDQTRSCIGGGTADGSNGGSPGVPVGVGGSAVTGAPTAGCGASGAENDEDDDDNSDFESGLDWPMDNHECTTCKKRYSTKKSLLRHQLLHEEPNFECDICNVKFYRKDKLKAHYDKCSEKNPDQVRKCNICGDSFENNEMLREHRSKHVTEGILTEEDLRDIEPRPEEKRQGEKIGRKRRTDIVGLECTECNKQYTSRKGLLRHIQVHEGKKYLCDICPKKFYRREHLKIHVAKHNMIKPYKCSRCTKRFIKEEQLTNHLSKHDRTFKKNKETDSSKRFLCEICSKSFTQSTTLIAHLRAHNGIKPYVCEVCSRPFTTNAYLKMHMRTHTQERPYICQYCSRAFARADTLANHLTSHTGEAKYHCKYCPKNFRRLKSLKEHVFIHTGQRPYACPTCDRRFNNNGSRYAHSKRCKQNFVQNQNRGQTLPQVQPQAQQRIHQTLAQSQVQVKTQNIKTITIARQPEPVTTQQVMQHQEILMPLILPLTVTLTDVGEEVILPEGTKIFTTS